MRFIKSLSIMFLVSLLGMSVASAETSKATCKQPNSIINLVEEQQTKDVVIRYRNEWFDFEECTVKQLGETSNLTAFIDKFKTINECFPEYVIAFNEWPTNLISERQFRAAQSYCNEKSLVRLDLLLNAIWDRIERLNGGKLSESTLKQQRAWLKYYYISCDKPTDDHPYSTGQYTFCKKRELEFRILSLSALIGEGGYGGWPAYSIDEFLNDFKIQN